MLDTAMKRTTTQPLHRINKQVKTDFVNNHLRLKTKN